MQTVFVAGGAGFIGSHLCEKLLQENYSVFCIDNLITGDKKNIESFLGNANFKFLEKDIVKISSDYFLNLPKPDFIFHLASPASPNEKSLKSYINYPIETLLVNSLGTSNLLELAKKSKAKFLFASTSEVYGDPAISPQSETYFGNVNPNGIRSVYDEAKRFGEACTFAFLRKFDVDVRIIRIFNTYGSKMQPDDGRVVSNLIVQALSGKPLTIYGDGKQTRSFCYISDMIEGIAKAMFEEQTKGQVINLGNPIEQTIIELAQLIKKLTQISVDTVFEALPRDDPKQRCPDINKAKKILDWEPKVSIDEGLKKTIDYFKHI